MRLKLLFIFSAFFLPLWSYAQCGPGTPTFNVNLTGNPDSIWTSPVIGKNDTCCGSGNPNRCIKFVITLDPGAVGVNFNIPQPGCGAKPSGSLYYQIGCGPPTPIGQPICLSGPWPKVLTFCKPGGNMNCYQITSIPPPTGGTNIAVNDGCTGDLLATGYIDSTITWNSIYPGAPGAYNSYLSCTSGCVNPTVTATVGYPPYVDYVICGIPSALCASITVCDTVRVTFNTTLLVTILPTIPTICFGATSITLTANGSGGTPPYNYLWNSVNTAQSINVGAGNYNVMLSDTSGCPPAYASVTVTSFSVTITANAGADQTVCSQNPTTVLNGSVTGASGGIWSGGAGVFSPNNTTLNAAYTPTSAEIAGGCINLTLITTGNGTCPADTDVVRICFVGFTGTVSVTPVNVSCFGGNNGSATAAVTGGISPYTYFWNTVPAQTTATASNLSPGTYSVTITNDIGCTFQTSVVITQPPPLAVNAAITNVSCFGGNNGAVTANAVGGTPGYTYSWNPGGQTAASATNLSAGTYTLTVTDNNGCQLTSTYTITQPPLLSITLSAANVSCFNGSNGSISSSVTGGTTPYTYNWNPIGATSPNVSGVQAGTYTVTITDNAGCTASNTAVITQPTAFTASVTSTNETCNYLNNGTATANVFSGTSPYTYNWQPGGQSSSAVSNLPAGTYTFTATDSKGCNITSFITITQPSALAINFINQTNVSCFGGSNGAVTANVTGGTLSYTYSWNPGGQTTANVSNFSAGAYTLTVTDNNDCQVQNSLTITQPPLLTVTLSPTNVSCFNGSNGSISSTPTGGTAPYTYNWNPIAATSPNVSGILAGIYTVTVTDSKGCTKTATATITQPTVLTASVTSTNETCNYLNNGTATVNVSGGTLPYSYNWQPGGQSSSAVSNLPAGTYTFTVTDSKGCNIISFITITQPSALAINFINQTNVSCFGGNNGAVTANVTGGTPIYIYSWNPGGQTTANITNLSAGSYTLTVTDNNGCQVQNIVTITQPVTALSVTATATAVSCRGGTNGIVSSSVAGGTVSYTYNWQPGNYTGQNVSNVAAGTYTVTVIDANGCIAAKTVTVTEPPLIILTTSSIFASCAASDGEASVTVSGGVAPYTYSWNPAGQTTSTATGLAAGTYTVVVTDANSCSVSALADLGNNSGPTASILSATNVSCYGGSNGSATANASGGSLPYTYSWNPAPAGQSTLTATGLAAGNYVFTVTDGTGCQSLASTTITQPPLIAIAVTTGNVNCFGEGSTASVSASGGTPGYTYTWLPGGSTGSTISGLTANTYTVQITDANSCVQTSTFVINQPALLTSTMVASSNVSCYGGSNGTATVSVSGGTPFYNYNWAPFGGNGPIAAGLTAGTYTVNIVDANGCTQSASVIITQPTQALTTNGTSIAVGCFGGGNGTAAAAAAGGTPAYTYLWSSGQTTSSATGLTAGTYYVWVTDSNGCQTNVTLSVSQPLQLAMAVTTGNITCFGGGSSASVSASGGTPGYTYTWLPGGSTGSTISGLTANTYTVQITDANSCVQTSTFVINQPALLTSTMVASSNVSCYGGSNGTATVSVSGGTPFYNYNWAPFGGNGPTAAGLTAGTYTVNIVDANGCTQSSSVTITQPTQALTASGTSVAASCFGGSSGSATVNPVSGTPGYTYQWSPAVGTGQAVSGLTAGTYYVLITDANGCQTNVALSILQPSSAVSGTLISSNPSCGLSNGTISSQVSGGTGPYTYLWTPGSSTNSGISGVGPGNYTLQVTDAANCVTTLSVTLTNIPGPSAVVSSATNVSCFGGNNGTATVNITQGTAPYLINWMSYGGNSSTATSLIAGNYTVNVADAIGCITSAVVTITEPTLLTVSISSVTPVSCNGGNNGTAAVTAAGGSPGYTYLWSNGQTASSVTSLSAGLYTVNIVDQNNCSVSIGIKISQPSSPLSSSISSAINPTCYGGVGNATIVAAGGTIPYYYSWSTASVQTGSIANLLAGSYTVTTTDANGCTSINNVIIYQPTQVITTASPNDTICLGQSAILTASASGGAGNYYYAWQPVGAINSGTLTITPSTGTTYIVVAYDQNGCLGIPDTVSAIVYSLTPANVQAIAYSPICPGQSSVVYVQTSGSTGPLTYLWGPPLDSTGPGGYFVTPTQSPATYIVTVTNSCGISITDSVQIILNPPPTVFFTSDTNSGCVPVVIQFFDNSVSNTTDSITSWYWSFGDNTYSTLADPIHVYTQSGTYSVVLTVTTSGGCSTNNGSAPLIIYATTSPIAYFTTNPSVTPIPSNNPTINFINQSSGATGYFWTFGDGSTSNDSTPQHHYAVIGFYTIMLITTNQYGCTDTFRLETSGEGGIIFPNAFTPDANGPNGGGYNPFNLDNNVFFPFAWGVEDFHMMIFNRWGELIFETFDIKVGWDGYYRGKLCQQDVYVWKASATFIDGKEFEQAGDVTLLR